MSARRPLPIDDLSRVEWAAAREILGRDIALGAGVLRVPASAVSHGGAVEFVPLATLDEPKPVPASEVGSERRGQG